MFHKTSAGGRLACALAIGMVLYALGMDAEATTGGAVAPIILFEPEAAARAGRSTRPDEDNITLEAIRADPAASAIRIGRSTPAAIASALRARAFSIVVPATAHAPQAAFAFTGVDVRHHADDLVSLYAQDAATDSEVALVNQGADLLGSMRRGDEIWQIRPLGDGQTAVYRYDTSLHRTHPRHRGEFLLKNERRQEQAPPRDDTRASGAAHDLGDVIDLLVAYTPAARNAVGNIDAFIRFAIDSAHRIYRNSAVGLRLRLVHQHMVHYAEHADLGVDLDRLSAVDDGHMDEIHPLRDHYGADLVALFVSGVHEFVCGAGWIADFGRFPDRDLSHLGFSVTATDCETIARHTFAHEIGHNQGADHNPDNAFASSPPSFTYNHGLCNVAAGWHTVMSYAWNERGYCDRREIPYLSSPNLRYQGTPTGDAAVRDNRRVLLETARRVANYRRSRASPPPPPPTRFQTIPLVTAASDRNRHSMVRIVNHSDFAGTVRIHAIDDAGRRHGPVSLSLDARAAVQLGSGDLEEGAPSKGLPEGVGRGSGHWRLELAADVYIEVLAYLRTPDGLLTSMHDVAAATAEGSNRYYLPLVNPGSNLRQRSLLRLINPGSGPAEVVITGVDNAGQEAPARGVVRLTLEAGEARMLGARELEQGGPELAGQLGDGTGKWRLLISADRPIQVMSLLQFPTGHLTNVSRGRDDVFIVPAPDKPDLLISSFSLNPYRSPAVSVSATVRNAGSAPAAATTLRLFRSPDSTISTGDVQEATAGIGALPPGYFHGVWMSGVTRSAGTYYYGVCVDAVHGELDTANNCSSALRVEIVSP